MEGLHTQRAVLKTHFPYLSPQSPGSYGSCSSHFLLSFIDSLMPLPCSLLLQPTPCPSSRGGKRPAPAFCLGPVPSLHRLTWQGKHGEWLEDCRYVCYHFFSPLSDSRCTLAKLSRGSASCMGLTRSFLSRLALPRQSPQPLPGVKNCFTWMTGAGAFPGLPCIPDHSPHVAVPMQCWIIRV